MAVRNLVLGGSGLVGSELCCQLRADGQEVENIDLKIGRDIFAIDLMHFRDYDYVWFLAWDVGGAKYLNDPDNFIKILDYNSRLCLKVFDFLKLSQLPFMFTSSQLAGMESPYGVTKKLGEEWTRALNGKIVRLWNVYGWEHPGQRSHVIPDLVGQAFETGVLRLLTDGKEERQFIHVRDCASNLIAYRERPEYELDLSTGIWISILELAGIIANLVGATVEIGKTQGFTNRLAPRHSEKVVLNLDLDQGIKLVVDEYKEYSNATKSL